MSRPMNHCYAITPNTDNREKRMLEDPQYSSVVRWGNEGDSFVVLEVRINPPPQPQGPMKASPGLSIYTNQYPHNRTKNSPRRSSQNTSSIATLLASSVSSTNMTFIKLGRMRRTDNLHTALRLVASPGIRFFWGGGGKTRPLTP